jgi:hypothetical protein
MALWGKHDTLADQPKYVARIAKFDSTAVNTTAKTIDLSGANTNFVTGTAVYYSINGGTVIGGLTDATTYFVHRDDAGRISLYDTQAHAISGGATGKVNITSAGVGFHTFKVDASVANPGYDHNYNGNGLIFVDGGEAQVTANRARGIKTPGWVTYSSYTDADRKSVV